MAQQFGGILLLELYHHGIELRGGLIVGQSRKSVVVFHSILGAEHSPGMQVDIAINTMLFQAVNQIIETAYLQGIEVPRAVRISWVPDAHGPGISSIDEMKPDNINAHARQARSQLISSIGRHNARVFAGLLRSIGSRRKNRDHHEIGSEELGSFSCARKVEMTISRRV